jgi:diguanylate cyclase (GGDEF)-like protein
VHDDDIAAEALMNRLSTLHHSLPLLFKQIVLLFRRRRATETERLTEKTVHLEFADSLEQDINALDLLVDEEWFHRIESLRLPRLKDFLPVQYIESAEINQVQFLSRQYDEKFHILQAPQLFLPDLTFFRAKCEERETPLAVAFLDIDHFKEFNTRHTEPKVDRNLLPRFMQAIEAHVYQHGYAYRQGGDEYLIIVPALSRSLSIAFFDELRRKLADLKYPEIEGSATVSIGLCIVEPDCPLTDRELRDVASIAKKFAKEHDRNCIATFQGPRFVAAELRVVRPEPQ